MSVHLQAPRATSRSGRTPALMVALLLAGALALGAVLLLRRGPSAEEVQPPPGTETAADVIAAEEPAPLTPRFEIGRTQQPDAARQRPPLEDRPMTPLERRFEGTARIEGYLDVIGGVPVPERWALVLEPSRVLIGGDRARPQRVEFEHGEAEFVLEDVPLGGYVIYAESERMSGARELLLLASPDALHVVVRVSLRPAAWVEGIVRHENGAPVDGLPMILQPLAGGDPLETRTDPRGAYLFSDVPDGEYRLFAGDPHSPLGPSRDLSVLPPSLHMPELVVPPLGELMIVVRDADGDPVADAMVQGWGSKGGRVDLTTDVSGAGRARFLPAGLVTLRAWAGEGPERRTANGSVELGPAEIRPIELRLAR